MREAQLKMMKTKAKEVKTLPSLIFQSSNGYEHSNNFRMFAQFDGNSCCQLPVFLNDETQNCDEN